MTTYRDTYLSEPQDGERIPIGTINYMRTRNRRRLYSLVINEFKNSGITQTELANRLGKSRDQISRWLSAPGNWHTDTASDLLFAISGGEPEFTISYPFKQGARNDQIPSWLPVDNTIIVSQPPAAQEITPTGSANTSIHILESA